jgi:hypothetical protein
MKIKLPSMPKRYGGAEVNISALDGDEFITADVEI